MPANRLRSCLTSLDGTGTIEIEYIETAYSTYGLNYLDNVCKAINPHLSYDKDRTEAQPDAFTSGSAYMYPSSCGQGWLGNDCSNGHGNSNYDGFYCSGKCKLVKKRTT